jgi:hypothetical protein
VRIFKVKKFARFQRRERVLDASLVAAVRDASRGLVDADLGGGLVKQRIARPGEGKRSGYRALMAYRRGQRTVFLLGFAKSERANVDEAELRELRAQAHAFLTLDDGALQALLVDADLVEVEHDDED